MAVEIKNVAVANGSWTEVGGGKANVTLIASAPVSVAIASSPPSLSITDVMTISSATGALQLSGLAATDLVYVRDANANRQSLSVQVVRG